MEKLPKRLEQEIRKRFSNGHRYMKLYSTSLVIQNFKLKLQINMPTKVISKKCENTLCQ